MLCYTYTEEEREEATLALDRELVIWGYLILEYSLSFILFLCKVSTQICQPQFQDITLTNCPVPKT